MNLGVGKLSLVEETVERESASTCELAPQGRHWIDASLLLAALDEVGHGLVVVDRDGRVRAANRSALRPCHGLGPLTHDEGIRSSDGLARHSEADRGAHRGTVRTPRRGPDSG